VEPSDWELVQRCKDEDRQAFRELVERYQRKTVAIALGMLHDREDALEVSQEAFAKVFTNIQQFKEEASFYTWLYRIVVNLAIDRQRQKGRQPLLEDDQGNGESGGISATPAATNSDPYEQVKDKELRDRIRAAIAELTPDMPTLGHIAFPGHQEDSGPVALFSTTSCAAKRDATCSAPRASLSRASGFRSLAQSCRPQRCSKVASFVTFIANCQPALSMKADLSPGRVPVFELTHFGSPPRLWRSRTLI